MHASLVMGIVYLGSEILLTVTRRAPAKGGTRQDKSTLRMLWFVIMGSVGVGTYVAFHFQGARLPHAALLLAVAIAMFAAGLALRWWAILVLGRFFTVDVTILKDHELVEAGPFRIIRHPSYTGILLAFLAFSLSLANWAALLVIMLPIGAAFVHRMNVEENALGGALGERYLAYMRRTKRLIPAVY